MCLGMFIGVRLTLRYRSLLVSKSGFSYVYLSETKSGVEKGDNGDSRHKLWRIRGHVVVL